MKPSFNGIEQLLQRAAREPDFADALLRDRCSTVGDLVGLSDCERSIIETVDGKQLGQMILAVRESLPEVERRDFLLEAVGAAAIVLGSGAAACDRDRERGRFVSFGLTAREPPMIDILIEDLKVEGALDPDVLRRIIGRHISEVWHLDNPHECAQILEHKAGGPLRTTLVLEIDAEGRVRAARTAIVRPEDALLGRCFEKATVRWKFPRPTQGAVATITIKLMTKRRTPDVDR